MSRPVAVLPPPVLERIRSRAEEAYPEECCGFLAGARDGGKRPRGPGVAGVPQGREKHETTGSKSTQEVTTVRILEELPTRNVAAAEDRRTTFLVEPRAVLDVMKAYRDRDEDVVGFYHSHPDHPAELSPTDREFARLWPRTVWLIVPVEDGRAGEARAWWLAETQNTRERLETKETEMIIRSSATADRAATPREERA